MVIKCPKCDCVIRKMVYQAKGATRMVNLLPYHYCDVCDIIYHVELKPKKIHII